jgi:hypothetical protein
MHLPSAGMIRFRFDGFAFASQPSEGHPEVGATISECGSGARAPGEGRMDATSGNARGQLFDVGQPVGNAALIWKSCAKPAVCFPYALRMYAMHTPV